MLEQLTNILPWGVAIASTGTTLVALGFTYQVNKELTRNTENIKTEYIAREICELKEKNVELKLLNIEKKIDELHAIIVRLADRSEKK